jgi:heat shock protein HslJ
MPLFHSFPKGLDPPMTPMPLRLLALAALTSFAWNAHASIAQDAGAGLPGTEWRLVSLGLDPVTGSTPTLRLEANGLVGGSTGCNTVKATYTSDGATLAFGPIGQTRKYCAAAFATERAYVAMLDDVRGFVLDGSTLVLTGGNGETLATFQAK